MVYEPWNLKHKKEMYEKKENWIVRLIYLFWIILLFVYCNIINSYVDATIFYWGFIIIGFIIVTFSYFFLVVLFMLKDSRFVKMNKSIAKDYLENKNAQHFLDKLLAIDAKPLDMQEEMIWYLNIASAYNLLGRQSECIALLKQLDEVATETQKKYIHDSIQQLQD